MSRLDNIINEAIDRFLNEDVFDEAKKEKKKGYRKKGSKKSAEEYRQEHEKFLADRAKKEKDKKKIRRNALKAKNGLRKDFNQEDDQKFNAKVSDEEQSNIEKILKSKAINVSAIAQELYPDHTKEGAQSQLNKKINGDISDSGVKYHLKNKEVRNLRKIINKMIG